MDRFELSRMILFNLDDLSSRSGHHSFEEACRYLAAARITSNVYPSTGPVAGGGDRGRDFQTYATHLREQLGTHGSFLGVVSDEPIAFCCSLQSKGLAAKIRSDVRKVAAGPQVSKVYAMVSGSLQANRAAELKEEVLEEHDITLEILDGQALADMLAAPDTFWIAARWLGVPADFAPEPDEEDAEAPEWYLETRDRWRATDEPPRTMGELLDVRAGLRRATFHQHARPDLGFWLARIALACNEGSDELRQRARYELSVAQLRGAGDLRPADRYAIAFLEAINPAEAVWSELTDASALLQYLAVAAANRHTDIEPEWVTDRNKAFRAEIRRRLRARGLTPTQKAGLLDVLGFLCTHFDLEQIEVPDEPGPRLDPIEQMAGGKLREPISADTPLVDPDGAIKAWLKCARLVGTKAPLVPMESTGRVLALLAPVLVDRPNYRALVDAMDQVIAEVAGASAAAERSRDRAMALLEDDRPLAALADLHEAKVRWWRGDTIRGSLLALLMLSRCYDQLGLYLAARQQALIAVVLAHAHGDDDEDLLASGLMLAAHADYRSGAWCAALEMYEVAMMAHLIHQDDPWDVECHDDLQAVYLHGGMMRSAAECADSKLLARVRALQREVGIDDVLTEVPIPPRTAGEWREEGLEKRGAVPFADAGADRFIQWAALGVTWEVRAVNTYSHCRAAERFAAAAQILCAELAQEDLLLLPTTIRVKVQASSLDQTRGRDRVRWQPGNDASEWIVDLIPGGDDGSSLDGDEVAKELLVALTQVIWEVSLAPWKKHQEVIERNYQRGLSHKVATGRPYDDAAGVVTRSRFDQTDRQGIRTPPEWKTWPVPSPVPALAERTDPGPGYDRKRSEQMIRRRYQRTSEMLVQTLPRLSAEPELAATYDELKRQGWKDWHVLLALANARMSFRASSGAVARAELEAIVREQRNVANETPDETSLPPEWLTVECLEDMRRLSFMTGAKFWHLELHQRTPDFRAVERLLLNRFGYATDDVPHPPLAERVRENLG